MLMFSLAILLPVVGLSWDPCPNVTGYYVYRAPSATTVGSLGTTSGPQLPRNLTPVRFGPITGTVFSDTTVEKRVVYYYAIHSIHADGTESPNSNIISIRIPTGGPNIAQRVWHSLFH